MESKLKVLRAERSWSQANLADRVGVSRQSINAIECDRCDPSLILAFKFSELFQSPIEEIFDPLFVRIKRR